MSLNIPTYTNKDIPILVASMLPMTMLLCYFLYGNRYFNEGATFVWGTLVTFIILGSAFITYGLVAISLRYRFPHDSQSFKRLSLCIMIFFLMSAVYISLLLLAYDHFSFLGYEYNEQDFLTAYISFIVVNVFLTFLNEGVYRYDKYKATITETEQLKKEYVQSQLLGLKSQMNPHFLFNSLNTLSSLIHEDAESAEDFLDHMSKVYRYLLRNNEEQLVTLETELNFIRSYNYLLKARYCTALNIEIKIPDNRKNFLIPPLTIQMVIENILNQHSISRSMPLNIVIGLQQNWIEVKHNIQLKMNGNNSGMEVLDNIANKYRLLCQQEIVISQTASEKYIRMPLIENKEMIVA
ncbi:MAG: sensor histidine kinase [Flavisolibacter sp.]